VPSSPKDNRVLQQKKREKFEVCFCVFAANRTKICFNLQQKPKKHEKFHLQPAANRTKICSKKFSKKKLFSRFCCKLKSFFLVFAANGSNLIEFSHVAYVKKRAPETSFFLPKHHLKSHFCLFINSIVNNISKCKLYWTLFARRGPLPRVSSRFMTSSLSFILK